MTFINPLLAAVGVACIAVPILIHLLMRRRRKPVPWAAMRFLLEAYQRQRRRMRMEQLLLLLTRCAVVALLALALGRPLLGQAGLLGGTGGTTVYAVLDNSLAGSAVGEDGESALDRHRRTALRALAGLDGAEGDRAGLITLGGPADPVALPATSDIGAVTRLLEQIQPTDSAADLAGAITRLQTELEDDEAAATSRTSILLLSDWLTGSADTRQRLPELENQSGVRLFASAPAEVGPSNVSVVGVEPVRRVVIRAEAESNAERETEGASTQVRVRLRRTGQQTGQEAVSSVRLHLEQRGTDGAGGIEPLGETTVRWEAGETEATGVVTVPLAALADGEGVLVASIDRDAVEGDNTSRHVLDVREGLRIGIVGPRRFGQRPAVASFEPADWIRLALSPSGREQEAAGELETVALDPGGLDAARLAGLDAVIVPVPDRIDDRAWPRLRAFADRGGMVMFAPPPDADAHMWADSMRDAFATPWNIATEDSRLDTPVRLSPVREREPADDPLALIAPELEELARPVTVRRRLQVEAMPEAPAPLLVTEDGEPVLLAARPGLADEEEAARGFVVLMTTAIDPEWTDLPARPLMVPLMQELARQGVGLSRGSWAALAGDRPAGPPGSAELRPLTRQTDEAVLSLDGDGRTVRPIRRGGAWRATDAGGASVGTLVVNADPEAGRTDPQSRGELEPWFATIVETPVQWIEPTTPQQEPADGLAQMLGGDDPVWPLSLPLLIAAALLAIFEVGLARRASHAEVRPPSGGRA